MMVSQYGDRWKQQSSKELTEKTRAEAVKFKDVLGKARSSDGTVRQRFAELRGLLVYALRVLPLFLSFFLFFFLSFFFLFLFFILLLNNPLKIHLAVLSPPVNHASPL